MPTLISTVRVDLQNGRGGARDTRGREARKLKVEVIKLLDIEADVVIVVLYLKDMRQRLLISLL